MIGLAASVAAVTLVVGTIAALLVMQLDSLRARIAGLALVATAAPMLAMVGTGLVMFESGHDVVMAAVAAGASLAALAGAWLVGRSITHPVQHLRSAASAMRQGDLTARAGSGGPRELRELGTSFDAMASEVERLFDTRQQLVAWASHDLQTPVTALRAMLEAIEDGLATPDRYLPDIASQVERLSTMVDDLFQLAVLDQTNTDHRLTSCDPYSAVRASVEAARPSAELAGVTLVASPPSDGRRVTLEADSLMRIISNLIENAVRHTPPGGVVEITMKPLTNNEIEVAVADTGPGITPTDQARVFEPFYRGDPARSHPGAGLGLAIARGLTEASGGTIAIDPAVERGTRIALVLPVAADAG